MAMTDNIIISADSHVFEPVNLWETRMDRKFRGRGPRFVPNYQQKPGTWFVCEGIPHTDSTWPRSRQSIERDFAGVSKADRLKMTCTNAAKLYGFRVNSG